MKSEKHNNRQEGLFDKVKRSYVVGGVVQKLDEDQVTKLRASSHNVVPLGEVPIGRTYIIAATISGGDNPVLITRES